MNSNCYKAFIFILFSWLLFSCHYERRFTRKKYFSLNYTPPGTIKIGNNLYFDETESSNTNYREYLYWTCIVFGDTSREYKSALPDTLVWMKTYPCLYSFVNYYLRHPAYQNYPVVGISQKQARDYSKWRSDRVMEYILVQLKKFDWDAKPDRNTCFTIERYFSGHYHNLKPDTAIKYYPKYDLPTSDEFLTAVHFSDSVDRHEKYIFIQEDIVPCSGDTLKYFPTAPVFSGYSKAIYNLRGNVREWLADDSTVFGGGWNEHIIPLYLFSPDTLSTQDAYTGFRNVCRWVKFKREY